MTTELDANPILPEYDQPNQFENNIPVIQGNGDQEDSTTDTGFSTPSPNSNSPRTRVPQTLLVRARTTGDYLQHVHDESRRRFLIDNGGPLAIRQFQISEDYGLDELRAPPILPDRERRKSLEHVWSHKTPPPHKPFPQRLRDDLIVASWIIFLSIWGSLARIGLSALSEYPGQPVFQLIWAQFVGCAVMGFLLQDKTLFPKDKRYVALYIGLTTGFCGSLTSFSSFIWNCFQALANLDPYFERARGNNVLALIAQVIITLSVSIAALRLGAHAAQVTRHVLPSITEMNEAKLYLDSLGIFLAIGSWSGAAIMSGLLPQWHKELLTAVLAPTGNLPTFGFTENRGTLSLATFSLQPSYSTLSAWHVLSQYAGDRYPRCMQPNSRSCTDSHLSDFLCGTLWCRQWILWMPIDGKYFCGRVRYTYEITCVYLCWSIYNLGNHSLGLDCGDIGLDTGIRASVRAVTCCRISSGLWDFS
jgi:fluoride ion exporter CrcB/FEX